MLQLDQIRKSYTTGDFTQVALDDVSIAFRDNEFVAVLGPSGSGKTTMLNIVGGLDHYDGGNLIIDGVETSRYKDRDWDTYRNNRVGFVFQSYNLIPHQTVLANVELALTLSGVSRAERRKRATAALEEVGLGDHIHKKPSQLSGGQMQRVAIARALINDPEILLADEPTGALDSKTSDQIMDLLTGIADRRLVVMVTHNPELAEQYATRIVNLRDGQVSDDSDPFEPPPGMAGELTSDDALVPAAAGGAVALGQMLANGAQHPPAEGIAEGAAAATRGTAADAEAPTTAEIPVGTGKLAKGLRRPRHKAPSQARLKRKDQPKSKAQSKSGKKTSMSFWTAISLSFNNLMTKKGRTLMTAFAGSIGIIGIAAILALATGVNNYIKSIEEDTLTVYPLTVQTQGLGLATMMDLSAEVGDKSENAKPGEVKEVQAISSMFESIGSNDLAALKKYLDADGGNIDEHVNTIHYAYDVTPQIFARGPAGKMQQVNPDKTFSAFGMGAGGGANFMSQAVSTSLFHELVDDTSVVQDQYEVLQGAWPKSHDEVLLVLPGDGIASDLMLYALGMRDSAELSDMAKQVANEEPVTAPSDPLTVTYDDLMGAQFSLVNSADYFVHDDTYDVWTDKSGDRKFVDQLVADGDELHVSGIVQPAEGAPVSALQPGIYYTPELTRHLVTEAGKTQVVKDQLAHPKVNVISGRTFLEEEEDPGGGEFDLSQMITVDEDKIAAAFQFDESQLSIDASALDFGMPALQFDQSTLPTMDLSDLGSGMDMSGLASQIDIDKITAELSPGETGGTGGDAPPPDIDQAAVGDLLGEMMPAYLAWAATNGCLADPPSSDTCLSDFLATPAGQPFAASINGIYQDATAGAADQIAAQQQKFAEALIAAIGTAVQQQMETSSQQMATQLEAQMTGYMSQAMGAVSTQIAAQLGPAMEQQIGGAMQQMTAGLAENMSSAMNIDEEAFMEAFQFDLSEDELRDVMLAMMGTEQTSFDSNLALLGYADYARPSQIDIYPIDFEGKQAAIEVLDDYNTDMEAAGQDEKVITYTDLVGTLMSSVTTIINVVSYVLVAFVAISLFVSSIMIGVITYISVLERKKEIGILRSIGASKRDIRRVFNAETLIVGFVAGAMGVLITALLTIPVNLAVSARFDISQVAVLPWSAAVVLILVSMGLTFLAGLFPSSAASRKDPVEALRSE